MSDIPGPEKPLDLDRDPTAPVNPNDLMAEFRRKLQMAGVGGQAGPTNGDVPPKRLRAVGAGGSGPYDGRSGTQLKGRVRPRHEMVVMLAVAGWKHNEIAEAMGYTPGRVSIIINSKNPKLLAVKQQAAARVLDNTIDLQAKFAQHAPTALNAMVDVMSQTADLAQRRLAARDILDRAGYSPVKKVVTANTNVPIEQLTGVLSQIDKANEAVLMSGQWEVRDARKDSA